MLDALLALREGGSSPAVTATEAGATSTTRDSTTGKVCVAVDKMAPHGMAVVVTHAADGGTSTDKTITVTIEECDTVNGTYQEVCKFPAIVHGAAANKMVRRCAVMRKYVRSVCTVAGSNGTISVDIKIHLGTSELDEV